MTDENLQPPLEGQLYAEVKNWHDSASGESGVSEPITTDIEKANVITSMVENRVTHHKVVLDIDLPAKLIPSSTPGHFHLYIDHEIEKDTYFKLVAAMVEAGLVEPGFLGASERRGYTAVRLPWIKKEDAEVSETKPREQEGHAWGSGDELCRICRHPVAEHYNHEEDPWCMVMLCKGCEHPEPTPGTYAGLSTKDKDEIDAMPLAQMLYEWRTAPLGTFKTGEPRTKYFEYVMNAKRTADPIGWSRASKAIGIRVGVGLRTAEL